MCKLNVVVIDNEKDIYNSAIAQLYGTEYHYHMAHDYDECPTFHIQDFYKKLIKYVEYDGDFYVFVVGQMPAVDLGRLEHCFYTLTGKRGSDIKVSSLEFLGRPNTPLKKFLMKRV